jgi:hypothetical protein
MIHKLERHIRSIGYIYDPPLDDYAGPEFAEPSPSPDVARWWASRVFPVDPLEADRFLCYMPTGSRPRTESQGRTGGNERPG